MVTATARMTNKSWHLARLLFGGVGLFALMSVNGCSSDATPGAAPKQASSISIITQPQVADLATSTTSTTAIGVTTLVPAITTAPIDGAALLSAAYGAAAPAYHFTSTVTIDGTVAASADGDRIGDNSRLTITGNGGAFRYIILGQTLTSVGATWVKPVGGEWQVLESAPATTDPIVALKTPLSVTVASATPEIVQLVVSVTPASLGLTGDAPLMMQVTISGTSLQAVSLKTTVSGKAAMVQTTIGTAKDVSPIVAPI